MTQQELQEIEERWKFGTNTREDVRRLLDEALSIHDTYKLRDEFYCYWSKRANKGEVSQFDRMEVLAINCFASWLEERQSK